MRPRWTETHPRLEGMLAKAKDLEDRVEKAGWEAPATEGSLQGPSHFEIETGGRIAHRPQYWTNQSLIEVEDVTNKGTIEESDPTTMMDAPPHDYGPTGSTLHDHVSGSDENPVSLTKSEDRVVGSIQGGDALRLHEVARAAENLARRLS